MAVAGGAARGCLTLLGPWGPQDEKEGPAPLPGPRSREHRGGHRAKPPRLAGDGGGMGTWEERQGRRGTKGGPEAWDPPSTHPASPSPRPASSPAVAAPSCLAPHIWQAARSLPVAWAAWREVKITLPLPLLAGAFGGDSRPEGGRGPAAAGDWSPPEAASCPSHSLWCPGRRGEGGWHGSQDARGGWGAYGIRKEGPLVGRQKPRQSVPKPLSPTPWRRGCPL